MANIEEALTAYLQKDVAGEGASLYRHLCELVGKIVDEKPGDVAGEFEKLSLELKQGRYRPDSGPDRKKFIESNPLVAGERASKRDTLFRLIGTKQQPNAEDFAANSAMLRSAGVGFSEEESYKVSLQLNSIQAGNASLRSLRFFGKVLGTNADYYVYEGQLQGGGLSDGAGAEGVEKRGSGANRYTYWVSNDPLGEVTQLPDVTAADIRASRLFTKHLSGDLYADVVVCPWFAGKEISLLRAQIARIGHSTKLHVGGFFELDDESGELKETEEFAFPASEELGAQGAWVHTADFLLENGNTRYPDGDDLEALSEEQRAKLDQEMEACPAIPVLTAISDDKPNDDGDSTAWRVKTVGDKSQYSFNDATKSYAVTLVSSTRWPGAHTVSQGSKICNFYCGYGIKAGSPVLIPFAGASQLAPAPVQGEPEENTEHPEPNPEDPPEDGAEEEAG